MRCPDCEKMVSYGEATTEILDESIDGGTFSCSVRIVLPCAECGTELKECILEFEQEIDHECPVEKNESQDEQSSAFEDTTYELEIDDPELIEDYRPKTRKLKNGTEKPVPFRYQKHYFGVSISGKAICNRCGAEIEIDVSQDEQSSAFEECG